MDDLEDIRSRASAATPGPWGWFGNLSYGGPYLATRHGGRIFVMQFDRLGMQGAQPVFQVRDNPDAEWGYMVKGAELAIREASHRDDIVGFANPDAEFIAHARQDVDELLTEVDRLRSAIAEHAAGAVAAGREVHEHDRQLWCLVGPDAIDAARKVAA